MKMEEDEEMAHISELLTKTRRRELEAALRKATSLSTVVIQGKSKKKISKSQRGSTYRGVSKNGKKWQVCNGSWLIVHRSNFWAT